MTNEHRCLIVYHITTKKARGRLPLAHAERFPYIPPLFSLVHQILVDQVSLGQVLVIGLIFISVDKKYKEKVTLILACYHTL